MDSMHNQQPSTSSQFPPPFLLQSPVPLNFTFNFNSPQLAAAAAGLPHNASFSSIFAPGAIAIPQQPVNTNMASKSNLLSSPAQIPNKSLQTEIWMQSHFDAASHTPSQSVAPSVLSAMTCLSDASSIHSQLSTLSNFNYGIPSSIPPSVSSPTITTTNHASLVQSPPQPAAKARPNINESFDVLFNSLVDKDPEVRFKCVRTMQQFLRKKGALSGVAEDKLRALTKLLLSQLLQLLQLGIGAATDGPCQTLISCLSSLTASKAFDSIAAEQSPFLAEIFCRLFVERPHVDSLLIIHSLISMERHVGTANRTVARCRPFLEKLLAFVKAPEAKFNHHQHRIAVNTMRILVHGVDKWKEFVVARGGIECLLQLVDVTKYPWKKLRETVLKTMLVLLCSEDDQFANRFIRTRGVEIVTKSIVDDFYPNTLVLGLKCLCMVSDVNAVADVELDAALHLAMNAILHRKDRDEEKDPKRLEIVRNAVGFISNVSCKSSKAKRWITTSSRVLDYLLSIALQCVRVTPDNERKREANEILERCMVAICVLNKPDNPERMLASKMLAASNQAKDLYREVMLASPDENLANQKRVIQDHSLKNWTRMFELGIIPDDLTMSKLIFNFINAAMAKIDKAPPETKSKPVFLLLPKLLQQVISLLPQLLDNPQHSEIIISLISEGDFTPFCVLNNLGNAKLCAVMLTFLIQLCGKEFSLRTRWARDPECTKILSMCAQSTDTDISRLGNSLIKMIGLENEDYTTTFYEVLANQMDTF